MFAKIFKGDKPGHKFHGNQWSDSDYDGVPKIGDFHVGDKVSFTASSGNKVVGKLRGGSADRAEVHTASGFKYHRPTKDLTLEEKVDPAKAKAKAAKPAKAPAKASPAPATPAKASTPSKAPSKAPEKAKTPATPEETAHKAMEDLNLTKTDYGTYEREVGRVARQDHGSGEDGWMTDSEISANYDSAQAKYGKFLTSALSEAKKHWPKATGHLEVGEKGHVKVIIDPNKPAKKEEQKMFAKVLKSNPKGINQYTKNGGPQTLEEYKAHLEANHKAYTTSEITASNTTDRDFFKGQREQTERDLAKVNAKLKSKKGDLVEVLGSPAQHGLVQKANPNGVNQWSSGASRASARQQLEASRQEKLKEKLKSGGTLEDGEAKAAGFKSAAHATQKLTKKAEKPTCGWAGDLGAL